MLFKPRGEYRVRIGDQASIKCFGYGYPAPYTLLTLPNHISKDKYNITHKGGFIEFSFIVEFSLAGNYTCAGKNLHGEKHDVLSLIGTIFLNMLTKKKKKKFSLMFKCKK